MKIFISWSGELSHRVALELRDWLPMVINALEPYVSSKDIEKAPIGSRIFKETWLILGSASFASRGKMLINRGYYSSLALLSGN
jgi:hypothetical protein